MTTLDELLESIDPCRTTLESAARADRALSSFRAPGAIVERWPDFQQIMTRFFVYVESSILRICPPRQPDDEFDWGHCAQVLSKIYGECGWKAAFEIARTGNEGGLLGVLRKVALRMGERYGEAEIKARTGRYWNELSAEEKIAAAREYLEKYRHLLPPELTEAGASRLLAEFPKVLCEHPRLMRKLRRIAR